MQAAEREGLIHSMSGALSAGPWALFGCACGLGVLVFVVAGFPGSEPTAQSGTRFAGAHQASANATVARSDVHRKMIFEVRRVKVGARALRPGSTSSVIMPHSQTTGP